MRKHASLFFKIAAVIILILLANSGLIAINSPEIRAFAAEYKLLGAALVVLFIVVSQVFAPLSGSPAMLVSAAVFGIGLTMALVYIAGITSAVINFYIAKKFGRNLVLKLAGHQAVTQMDKMVRYSGIKLLVVCRLLGFSIFDIISYAFGLTTMKFKPYFLVTAIASVIPNLLTAIFLKDLNFTNVWSLLIWFISIFVIGVIFSLVMRHQLKDPA